jgi:hypothetical protein
MSLWLFEVIANPSMIRVEKPELPNESTMSSKLFIIQFIATVRPTLLLLLNSSNMVLQSPKPSPISSRLIVKFRSLHNLMKH